jgi:8-oxo-dGTP diphosphatase
MKKYVLGFYFDGDRVLLINKTKPEWQRGKLNGLGGTIETGEAPLLAMVREFKEESGIDTNPTQWVRVADLRGTAKTGEDWEMFVYRATGEIPANFMHECDEGRVFPWSATSIPLSMEQTARWLVALCMDKSIGIQGEIAL